MTVEEIVEWVNNGYNPHDLSADDKRKYDDWRRREYRKNGKGCGVIGVSPIGTKPGHNVALRLRCGLGN